MPSIEERNHVAYIDKANANAVTALILFSTRFVYTPEE